MSVEKELFYVTTMKGVGEKRMRLMKDGWKGINNFLTIINNLFYHKTGSIVTSLICLQTQARESKSFAVKNEHMHKATSSGRSKSIFEEEEKKKKKRR